MSAAFKVHEEDLGLKSHHRQRHKLTHNGYIIPFMEGQIVPGDQSQCAEKDRGEPMWHFLLDNSLSVEVPLFYGSAVAHFVANAMAVAAGYTCFGENAKPANQFKRRMFRLETVPEIESMETEGSES